MTSADATIGLFGSKTPEAKTLPLKHRQHNTGKTFLVNNGNDSNLLIVFYVQIMPDDFVMQLHRF